MADDGGDGQRTAKLGVLDAHRGLHRQVIAGQACRRQNGKHAPAWSHAITHGHTEAVVAVDTHDVEARRGELNEGLGLHGVVVHGGHSDARQTRKRRVRMGRRCVGAPEIPIISDGPAGILRVIDDGRLKKLAVVGERA